MWAGKALAMAALLCCALGCGGDSSQMAHKKKTIQNAGSDTLVNVAQAWAEDYALVEPEVSVEVSGGGSGTGLAALTAGTVDIANSSRHATQAEIERARQNTGKEPVEFTVGYDALAIFVHPSNPMEEITIAQIAEIYAEHGKATHWAQLGVRLPGKRGDKIIRVSRQSNSGTYHFFREAILGKTADFRLGSLDLHGSKDVVELIARTPNAIGYSGMGYATHEVKMLRVATKPGEKAIIPCVESTMNGSYPIARPLLMYTLGEPAAHVRAYLQWIYSATGQAILAKSGYVPAPKEQHPQWNADAKETP